MTAKTTRRDTVPGRKPAHGQTPSNTPADAIAGSNPAIDAAAAIAGSEPATGPQVDIAGSNPATAKPGRKPTGDAPRVFLKKKPDGTWRACWYGRWTRDGKTKETSLCPWQGEPPEVATGEGNRAFEASRAAALQMLKDAIREGELPGQEAAMIQRVHEIRYGDAVGRVKLSALVARWDALPHKGGEKTRERVHTILKRFLQFMAARFPTVTDAGGLTATHFKGFLDGVEADGCSPRTWNDYMTTLRSVLKAVDGNSRGFREYLSKLKKKDLETISRRPFTAEELEAVFAAALDIDPELHPALVTAAYTALRRGDVCNLQWADVDLEEGFIAVRTAKTGEQVEIPILAPLAAVLKEAARTRKPGVPYVFPRLALAYACNPFNLNWRLNKVLARAGFAKPDAPDAQGGKYPAAVDAEAEAAMVEAGMDRAGWTAKRRAKARKMLALHREGKNGKEIAAALEVSEATVSETLHAMEDAGGVAIVSRPRREAPAKPTLADARAGQQRKRRGCLAGWHSFRTTFCSLALANGLPMPLLQEITGHKTSEIVLKHYNKPRRDQLKAAVQRAMLPVVAAAPAAPAAALPPAGEVLEGEAVEIADTPAAGDARAQRIADALADVDAATLAKIEGLLQRAGRFPREASR